MQDQRIPAAAAAAIRTLGLSVERVLDVPESHASIVRILQLTGGEEVVLKLPWNATKLRRERAALAALADEPLTPHVLDVVQSEDSPAILLSRLPGAPIGDVSQCTVPLAAEIGAALARVHSVSLPMAAGEDEEDWWRELHAAFLAGLARCRASEPHEDWDRAAAVAGPRFAGTPPVDRPALTHFDYRLGNLLSLDGRLTGVIDFESARNGSGAMDLTKLVRTVWTPRPELRAVMLSAYESVRPLPEPIEAALPFYDLCHGVAGVAWCEKRGGRDVAFRALNRRSVVDALDKLEEMQ